MKSYRQRWSTDASLQLAVFVVVASIPTAILGLAFKDLFEALFSNLVAVSAAFFVTAFLLLATRLSERRCQQTNYRHPTDHNRLTVIKAAVIGVAQGIAITPGISRSGATIASALLLGVDRAIAARFSFMIALPAIAGASVLSFSDAALKKEEIFALCWGAFVAAMTGYAALRMVISSVVRGKLHVFSYYLIALGSMCLLTAL